MTFSQIVRMTLLLTAVAACTTVPRIVNEYKIDVQQGNVLTQDMVAQLKPGLSKDQVRFLLGTPVLMDMFHANRWEYVYRMQKGNGAIEMRQFSAFFDANDKLVRVGGDVAAAQSVDIAGVPESKSREIDLGSIAPGSVAPPLEEKGFFGRMMESVGF